MNEISAAQFVGKASSEITTGKCMSTYTLVRRSSHAEVTLKVVVVGVAVADFLAVRT